MSRTMGLLVVTALLSGCYTVQVGDFTLVANENLTLQTTTIKRNLHGEHCTVLYSQNNQPSIERAVDQIHDQVETGSALQNVTVEYYIAPLYYIVLGRACYRVTGDVISIDQ